MSEQFFITRAPEVGFAAAGVPPPSPLYIGPGEALRVDSWSCAGPGPLTIIARVLTPRGEVVQGRWSHQDNWDRTLATSRHPLAEGHLLNVTVDAIATNNYRGWCWVNVAVQRGEEATGIIVAQLIAGYATGRERLAWPGGRLQDSLDGHGAVYRWLGADPAAGSEATVTLPTGARWRIYSARFELVTDATVANRQVDLVVDDGTYTLLRIEPAAVQTASQTIGYNYGCGFPVRTALTAEQLLPLPAELWARGNYRLRTVTANLQAADNFARPVLLIEEWIDV